jgi:hypothetical protein
MAQLLNRVQRGDVITADMWNLVVDTINELLESGQTTGIKVTGIVPSGTSADPLRIGTVMQIVGQNFGFSIGQASVTFEWTKGKVVVPREKMLIGSADDRLLLIVPPTALLPQEGATMTMRVDNGVAHDTRSVFVMPIAFDLDGDMFVNWRADVRPNPNPNPLQPKQPAEFAFELKTGITMPATFDLSADILDATTALPPTLVKSIQFIDARDGSALKNKSIEMGKTETRNIIVRIPLIPDIFADQSFKLSVSASAGKVSGTDARSFTVGKEVAQIDPNIHPDQTGAILLDENNNEDPNPQSGSFDGTTIKLRAGKQLIVMYNIKLDRKGDYDVSLQSKEGTTLKGWGPFTNPKLISVAIDKDPVLKNAQFSVSVTSGSASPSGTVVFRIKRQGETQEWSKEFDVQLLT